MRRTKSSRCSPLTVLRLETREVPAGNVSAVLFGPTLTVTGDSAANDITISRSVTPGVIEVQGSATRINGQASKIRFAGVRNLIVDMGDGNDKFKTQKLQLDWLDVNGGFGDDNIQIKDTTNLGPVFNLSVFGDPFFSEDAVPNGADTIDLVGTEVIGSYASLTMKGDQSFADVGAKDRINIENTKLNLTGEFDAGSDFNLLSDDHLSGPGNTVTISNLNLSVNTFHSFNFWYLQGSTGDDAFSLRNVDVNVTVSNDTVSEFGVFAGDGYDTIHVSNANINVISTDTIDEEGDEFSFYLFNQTIAYFDGEAVSLLNFNLVGGGTFYLPLVDSYFLTVGEIYVTGSDVSLSNTQIHTNGGGGLNLFAPFYWDGTDVDTTFQISNVEVTSANQQTGNIFMSLAGGDDSVSFVNVLCTNLLVDLGAGNDSLTLNNLEAIGVGANGWIPNMIFGGDGDDNVLISNSSFSVLEIELWDGDDSMSLTNNTFVTASISGGIGNDTLNSRENDGTLTPTGFEIIL